MAPLSLSLAQLTRLVVEFELLRLGVPLQWRWRRHRPSSPPPHSRYASSPRHTPLIQARRVTFAGLHSGSPAAQLADAPHETPWVVELNRELCLSQLVPDAVPADGAAAGAAWLVPAGRKHEAEARLRAHRAQLRKAERPTAGTRGLDEKRVVRARDQVNGRLRS